MSSNIRVALHKVDRSETGESWSEIVISSEVDGKATTNDGNNIAEVAKAMAEKLNKQ